MPIPDQPMLALIARFVGADVAQVSFSDEAYLRHQFAEIRAHVENYPAPARQQAALDWIREHAERYRAQWQQRALSELLLSRRCDDCPIADDGVETHCIIHQRWVELLNEYIAGEIDADRYVEETLQLLNEHKSELKISPVANYHNAHRDPCGDNTLPQRR